MSALLFPVFLHCGLAGLVSPRLSGEQVCYALDVDEKLSSVLPFCRGQFGVEISVLKILSLHWLAWLSGLSAGL